MLQVKAVRIFQEIKHCFENCINNTHLDVAIEYYSRQLNQLFKEYPSLHNELMDFINEIRNK
jgi:predicted ester cyclase